MPKTMYIERFRIFPPEVMVVKLVDRALNIRDGRTDGIFTPQYLQEYIAMGRRLLEIAEEMGLARTPYYQRLAEEVGFEMDHSPLTHDALH
jgi:hypothetical protein